MPSLTVKTITTISADQFIKALTDFGSDRAKIWGNSQSNYLIVHELGSTTADVTEGSSVLGGVWERLHYDWSIPGVIELRTIDSNIWVQGSRWQYKLEKTINDQATLITAKVTRYPKSKKGYLVLFLIASIGRPLILRSFRKTLRAIEERNKIDIDKIG